MNDTKVLNLAEEAAFQWGLFTQAQSEKVGVSRGRIDMLLKDGQVQLADTENVYRFAGAPIDAMLDALRTQWLALTPDRFLRERLRELRGGRRDTAIVSHVSAACLVHDLGTLTPRSLDFTVAEQPAINSFNPNFMGTDRRPVGEGFRPTHQVRGSARGRASARRLHPGRVQARPVGRRATGDVCERLARSRSRTTPP